MNMSPKAIEQPQSFLISQVEQIESRLKGLTEIESQISQAIGRLINPRPSDCAEGATGTPQPSTVEGRLQNIVRMLDSISADLRDHAQTLDSAV